MVSTLVLLTASYRQGAMTPSGRRWAGRQPWRERTRARSGRDNAGTGLVAIAGAAAVDRGSGRPARVFSVVETPAAGREPPRDPLPDRWQNNARSSEREVLVRLQPRSRGVRPPSPGAAVDARQAKTHPGFGGVTADVLRLVRSPSATERLLYQGVPGGDGG